MSWRGGSTHRLIRVLAFVVTVGSVLLAAVPALAGILDTSWTAPTTSADGSPLTDLASYRVYYGLSTPPSCPGTSYLQFASSTPSPAPGQTVTARLTGLSTGSLYYVAVTAVDTNGNESACITPLSAVARIDFSVSPTATVNFGSVAIGGLADQTFTVQNTGGGTVSGTASVPAPFSVVSGGSFNLVGVGATQAVTVRFSPTVAATASASVTFTANGASLTRVVTGLGVSSAPPGAATLVAPSGSIATATPTFSWNAVALATQYLLWVDDSSGGRLRTTYTAAQVGCATGIGTCSMVSSATLNPGTGQWWVVTSNASGSGPWSNGLTFTVAGTPPPTAATLVAPSGSIASRTPTFSWNAVASATQYMLWVDDSYGGRIRTTYTGAQAGCASGAGACSMVSSATLNPGAGQWWIVTSSASGSGPWSSGMTFTVAGTPPPPAATIVAPSGSLASATPTFTWNAVGSATAYMLWVDDSSGGRSRATYTAAQAGCGSGTGTCSLAPGLVLNPGAGQWWVVTSNTSGSGPWSNGLTFTVAGTPPPPAATLVAPSGSIATRTPTFSWNAVASATQYLLWVDDSSGGRLRTTYTAAQVGCASGTGTCSIAPGVVLNPGAGQWWVVTSNASGSGPWSSGMTFTAP